MADSPDLAGQRHLFVDDYVVEEARDVRRVMNRPVKYAGNPVIRPAYPIDHGINIYGTLMHDAEMGLYRMWYQGYGGPVPNYACYATSRDGVYWEKPELGIVEMGGDRENNVVLEHACVPNVIRDSRDGDPGRLYKMLFWDRPATPRGTASVSVAFSPDGIRWTKYEGNPVLLGTHDTHTLFGWDESYGKYVAYIRPRVPMGKGITRVVGRSVSDDFVDWTEPEVVLAPDDDDPPGLEFYGMPVFKYEGLYLGLPWAYHTHPEESYPRMAGSADVQLASSRDGIKWERVGDREPFIPLGPPGSVDQGMVYCANQPLAMGDELWFYYGGFDNDHAHPLPSSNICLAKLRLDGFVSMDADAREGTVVTRAFRCGGGELVINASARGGTVSVAVLDEQGVEVDGYRAVDCALFDGDSVRHRVTWRENVSLGGVKRSVVRLKFYLRNAKLYSFVER